jgi:hypothetical protein
MSKIVIEIDTETELMAVSVDGTALENVSSVDAYNYGDEVSVRINQTELPVEKNGLRKYTTLCASEAAKLAEKEGKAIAKVGDLIKIESGKPVYESIANLLESYR